LTFLKKWVTKHFKILWTELAIGVNMKKLFLFLFLLLSSVTISACVYYYHSSRDPSNINVNLNDLSGYSLVSDVRYERADEVANVTYPYFATFWAEWGFETGSDRMFSNQDSVNICKVYRFSTIQGAKFDFYAQVGELNEYLIDISEEFGDDSFAVSLPEDRYEVYFFKSKFTGRVNADSLVVSKNLATIIVSRIERQEPFSDFVSLLSDNLIIITLIVVSLTAIGVITIKYLDKVIAESISTNYIS